MSRLEALLSAGLVYVVAHVVRAWAATQSTFPRPEDVAYYVSVARNLVEGRGLVSDAIWSFNTPPLVFPLNLLKEGKPFTMSTGKRVEDRRGSNWVEHNEGMITVTFSRP